MNGGLRFDANLSLSSGRFASAVHVDQVGFVADGFELPWGVLSFEIVDIEPAAMVEVTLEFPEGERAEAVLKCSMNECDEYHLSGQSENGRVLTWLVVDGSNGDDDGQVDGRILDPVAPAIRADSRSGSGSAASSLALLLFCLLRSTFSRSKRHPDSSTAERRALLNNWVD